MSGPGLTVTLAASPMSAGFRWTSSIVDQKPRPMVIMSIGMASPPIVSTADSLRTNAALVPRTIAGGIRAAIAMLASFDR